MTQPKVVDVSIYNDFTNWDQVALSVDGIIMRATWRNYVDATCAPNLVEAVKRNLRVGLYHFYQPDTEWSIQLNTFLNFYLAQKQKTVIGLDCEDVVYTDSAGRKVEIYPPSRSVYTNWLCQWLLAVEKVTGQVPTIYTRKSYWEQWVSTPAGWDWTKYPLWVANYGVSSPAIPKPWAQVGYTLWQYSSTERIPGIYGNVDASWFHGDIAALERYMPRPGVVVPPPPPPAGEYQVHLAGTCYALTVRTGPGAGYAVTGKYLVNTECPQPSKAVYTILEVNNGWGKIAQPYVGWVSLAYTIKA